MYQDAALGEFSLVMKTDNCPTNIHVSEHKLLGAEKEGSEPVRASLPFLTVGAHSRCSDLSSERSQGPPVPQRAAPGRCRKSA